MQKRAEFEIDFPFSDAKVQLLSQTTKRFAVELTVSNEIISFLYNTFYPFLLLAYSLLCPCYALATISSKKGLFKVSFLYKTGKMR